jgi:hypothetical protein
MPRPRHRGNHHPRDGSSAPAAPTPPGSRHSCPDPMPASAGGPRAGHSPGNGADSEDSDHAPQPADAPTPPAPVLLELHLLDHHAVQSEQRLSYPEWAHVAPPLMGFQTSEAGNPRNAAACAPSQPPRRGARAPTSLPKARPVGAIKQRKPPANHKSGSRPAPATEALFDRRRPGALPRSGFHPTPPQLVCARSLLAARRMKLRVTCLPASCGAWSASPSALSKQPGERWWTAAPAQARSSTGPGGSGECAPTSHPALLRQPI